MSQEIAQYLTNHPRFFIGALAFAILLAGVGLWYVIYHHLQVILTTLLCLGGMASGIVVLYRGITIQMNDLIGVGLFLIVIFPVIFWQAIKLSYAEPPEPKGASKEPATKKATA